MLNKIPKPVSSRGISSSTRGYVGVLNEIFDLPLGRGSHFPLSSLSTLGARDKRGEIQQKTKVWSLIPARPGGGGKELSGKHEPLPSGKSNSSLRTPTYPLVNDEIPLELTGFGFFKIIPPL